MRIRLAMLSFAVACFQHHIAAGDLAGKTVPIISASAKGWTIRPGPQVGSPGRTTTIVINPKGKEFNIGTTQYPDVLAATLWIVEVKELKARFLIIRVPPVASAGVEMPVIYISQDNTPSLAGKILQHFEFPINADDKPGINPKIRWDGEHNLKDLLFADSDSDGVPELVENNFWQSKGTVTYFRFTKQRTFIPLWRETWQLRTNDGFEKVSRIKIENGRRL